jgi:UDP-glucose 6-dehydrogenase
VGTGGILLENFLNMTASWSVHKIWKQLIAGQEANGQHGPVGPELQRALLDKVQTNFYAWIITTTAYIVSKARKQLFFNTFIARYHGLSRNGSDIIAQFGLTMKKNSYDCTRKEVVETARAQTAEVRTVT